MNSNADSASIDSSDTASTGLPLDRPTLILSKGDSSNDTYGCDALGYHYELSTPESMFRPQRLSTIYRWDANLNRKVPVAEWERYMFKKDRVKVEALGASDFVPLNDVFPRTWGLPYDATFNRSFVAPSRKQYTWKSRPLSMKLYCAEGGKETLIAAYHRGRYVMNARKPFVELFDGYEDILDLIIITCTIAVAKRKDGESNSTGRGWKRVTKLTGF